MSRHGRVPKTQGALDWYRNFTLGVPTVEEELLNHFNVIINVCLGKVE